MNKFELREFFKEIHGNEFVKACALPISFKASYPIIKEKDGKVFLIVPFKRTVRTSTPGVSAVMPIQYTMTFRLNAALNIPEAIQKKVGKEPGYSGMTPVAFESLEYTEKFEKVAFDKPADLFPGKELKEIGPEIYKEKLEKLYDAYDAVINGLLGIEKCAGIDKLELKQSLSVILGPVVKKMYEMIDKDFAEAYLK